MSVTLLPPVTFNNRFGREIPEMAVAWQAEPFPDAPFVVNERLAPEVHLHPVFWSSPDGVRVLTGKLVPGDAAPVPQAHSGH